MQVAHPVMNCAEARAFEKKFFAGDTDGSRVRYAMRRAGADVARETRALLDEAGAPSLPILVLCGKGRNAGDALIAAAGLLDRATHITVAFAFSRSALGAEAREALEALEAAAPGRVETLEWTGNHAFPDTACLVIDGLTGAGFRPPLALAMSGMIHAANRLTRAIRVAVDLPSGAGDESDETLFRADLTVATGILKSPLLTPPVRAAAGRIRYADIGFFESDGPAATPVCVLAPEAFARLRTLRRALCDKRDFGHVAIVGGHRTMPGALLMNVLGALRAGAGLVTAFCPESVHAAFAAAAPEAMWVPLPETPEGGLPRDALPVVLARLARADALVCGSGIGDSHEAIELIANLVSETTLPLVLDADALRPSVMNAVRRRPTDAGLVAVTPHAGEFRRIAGHDAGEDFVALNALASDLRAIVLLKGPLTRVSDGHRTILVPHGGPALARGGSGDLLAGILGARIAAEHHPDAETVAIAAAWHGAAADHVARHRFALRTTDILDGLGPCLRAD